MLFFCQCICPYLLPEKKVKLDNSKRPDNHLSSMNASRALSVKTKDPNKARAPYLLFKCVESFHQWRRELYHVLIYYRITIVLWLDPWIDFCIWWDF